MAEDIRDRLKNASEECLKCYEAWSGNDKDDKVRESLQDAIHELRKVSSRLEIELAISERDQMAQKPIPIPPHRDAKKRVHKGKHNNSDDNDNRGNSNQGDTSSGPAVERKPTRRRTAPKKASGGDS